MSMAASVVDSEGLKKLNAVFKQLPVDFLQLTRSWQCTHLI